MNRENVLSFVTAKSGRAKVLKVEIPTALQKFNADNHTLRVRIVACWESESDTENSVQSLLRSVVGNNEFSQIANLDGYNVPEGVTDKAKHFADTIKGKTFFATKYSVSIQNLARELEEKYNTLERVNDPIRKRTYATLTDCTLDTANDDDKVVIYERLVNRLRKRLADQRLLPGGYVESGGTSNPPTLGNATGATVGVIL